jgi:hypothetical protein
VPTFGRGLFGATPIGRPSSPDASSPPAFLTLLQDPSLRRIQVIELNPWDPTLGAEKLIRYSDDRWIGDEAPPMRLTNALELQASVFADLAGDASGGRVPGNASVSLRSGNARDELDALADYYWDDRPVVVKMGGEDFEYSQFQPIFVGKTFSAEWEDEEMRIAMADPAIDLRKPIQETKYAGTGGLEGGEDLKGKDKPITIGRAQHVSPVLVDRNLPLDSPIFQTNNGPVDDHEDVYDNGLPLTAANGGLNDITELPGGPHADIYAPTVALGEWIQDRALGLIRLGAPIDVTPTVTLRGMTFSGTYYDRAVDLVEHVCREFGGYGDAQFDGSSFARLDLDTSAPTLPNDGRCNVYIPNGSGVQILTLVDELLRSVFAFWTFTRLGALLVARVKFRLPDNALEEGTGMSFTQPVRRVRTPRPQYRRTLSYGRSWTVLGEDDLRPGADPAIKDFMSEPVRFAVAEDLSVQTPHPRALSVETETLLDDEGDAQALVDEQLALLKVKRDRYDVEVKGRQLLIRPGDTITLTYPRWGLDAGRDYVVVGLGENTVRQTTELRLWG